MDNWRLGWGYFAVKDVSLVYSKCLLYNYPLLWPWPLSCLVGTFAFIFIHSLTFSILIFKLLLFRLSDLCNMYFCNSDFDLCDWLASHFSLSFTLLRNILWLHWPDLSFLFIHLLGICKGKSSWMFTVSWAAVQRSEEFHLGMYSFLLVLCLIGLHILGAIFGVSIWQGCYCCILL
jgi:hypothetical protein